MHTLSSPSYIFLCMLKSAVDVDSIHDSYSVSFFFFKYIASTQSYIIGHPFGHSDSVFQCWTNCHLSHVKSTEVGTLFCVCITAITAMCYCVFERRCVRAGVHLLCVHCFLTRTDTDA